MVQRPASPRAPKRASTPLTRMRVRKSHAKAKQRSVEALMQADQDARAATSKAFFDRYGHILCQQA